VNDNIDFLFELLKNNPSTISIKLQDGLFSARALMFAVDNGEYNNLQTYAGTLHDDSGADRSVLSLSEINPSSFTGEYIPKHHINFVQNWNGQTTLALKSPYLQFALKGQNGYARGVVYLNDGEALFGKDLRRLLQHKASFNSKGSEYMIFDKKVDESLTYLSSYSPKSFSLSKSVSDGFKESIEQPQSFEKLLEIYQRLYSLYDEASKNDSNWPEFSDENFNENNTQSREIVAFLKTLYKQKDQIGAADISYFHRRQQ